MKKNILLLVILAFFVTGCGSSKMDEYEVDYNLKINDVFYESITVALPKDAYDIAGKDSKKNENYNSLEYSLLKSDINPIFSNYDELYRKEINKYNNMVEVNLKYNYPEKYYVYNNFITSCFSNYDLISSDDNFEIKLSGAFICGNKIEKLNISVTSNYDVLESNGKKDGKTYTWSIGKKDFEKIDIDYKISRKYSKMAKEAVNGKGNDKRATTIRNLRIVTFVIMIIVIIAFSVRFYFMKKDLE